MKTSRATIFFVLGLAMLMIVAALRSSSHAQDKAATKHISDSGVVIAAFENTMRRKNVKKDDLLLFATTVPSGIAEVVLTQDAGEFLHSQSRPIKVQMTTSR